MTFITTLPQKVQHNVAIIFHWQPRIMSLRSPHKGNVKAGFMLTTRAFSISFSHAYFCFEIHERLSDRSTSKPTPRAMPRDELKNEFNFKSADTGFYWLSANAPHERIIAERWR